MAKPIRHRDKWRIRWFDETGKRQSDVFDSYREAEYQLARRQAEVEEIKRGLRSPTPPAKTVDDICDYWLEKRAPQKRSGRDDESIIRCHLRPAFGALPLRAVNQTQVDTFIVERLQLSKKTVNNHLTLLVSMLNLARDLGWLDRVPRVRKPRVRIFTRDYRYLRTDEEIQRFLRSAHEETFKVYTLYATALYTGMRAGELAGLKWSDVDVNQRLIAVQRSFSGPTKAEDMRHVPVLDALLPTLRDWRLHNPLPLVFPNDAGRMHDESARVFQEVLHRVLERASFPRVEVHQKMRAYVGFHDLRHTFASHWMMRGGDLFKLQKILGHKSVQMTMRYAHLAPDAFAEDWGRFGKPAMMGAEVLPFTSATGAAVS